MRLQALVPSLLCCVFIGCMCGPTTKNLCEGTSCSLPLTCDPATGSCRFPGTSNVGGGGGGTGSGGGAGGSLAGGNAGGTTSGGGVSGGSVSAGGVAGGTSGVGGGGAAGGSASGGGAAAGGGAGAGYCVARRDGGVPCRDECTQGFSCVGGFCELNGGTGPVQITLRFDQVTDVDLHVREPLPDGGHCEIYYGDKNLPDSGRPSSCGAVGWLDLDSNAACGIDRINIENVIYDPSHPAPRGRYEVYVDYYQYCLPSSPTVRYEVEVRSNGSTRFSCGSFSALEADEGGRGSGRLVTWFDVR